MSVQGSAAVTIQASPEQVWPWVADITKHGEWSPKPYNVELVSGEAGTVGSRYKSVGFVPPKDADHVNEVEIMESSPTTKFVLNAYDSNGTYVNSYTLVPRGSGTEVTFHIAFPRMNGASRFLLPILFPLVGKSDLRKRMSLLKDKVESQG